MVVAMFASLSYGAEPDRLTVAQANERTAQINTLNSLSSGNDQQPVQNENQYSNPATTTITQSEQDAKNASVSDDISPNQRKSFGCTVDPKVFPRAEKKHSGASDFFNGWRYADVAITNRKSERVLRVWDGKGDIIENLCPNGTAPVTYSWKPTSTKETPYVKLHALTESGKLCEAIVYVTETNDQSWNIGEENERASCTHDPADERPGMGTYAPGGYYNTGYTPVDAPSANTVVYCRMHPDAIGCYVPQYGYGSLYQSGFYNFNGYSGYAPYYGGYRNILSIGVGVNVWGGGGYYGGNPYGYYRSGCYRCGGFVQVPPSSNPYSAFRGRRGTRR
jgi:hypothetical protein